VTHDERRGALEAIATEIGACTRCRLHETRTRAVPGEGNPDTEVVFVGEGPGFNEDREGRPFVGRAGGLLVRLLASIQWRREDVFITNVVKCRPPGNRDPLPDELAACAPFLRRQLEALDPAVVVTLGRYSLNTFMPGARIGQAHGTARPIEPGLGSPGALALALYHPAAALRSAEVDRMSFEDVAQVPGVLLRARAARSSAQVQPDPESAAATPAASWGTRAPGETTPGGTAAALGEPAPGSVPPDAGPAGSGGPVRDPLPPVTTPAPGTPSPRSLAGVVADHPAPGEPSVADDAQLTLF
jgi:uracil-DNA glycosylase family 4